MERTSFTFDVEMNLYLSSVRMQYSSLEDYWVNYKQIYLNLFKLFKKIGDIQLSNVLLEATFNQTSLIAVKNRSNPLNKPQILIANCLTKLVKIKN